MARNVVVQGTLLQPDYVVVGSGGLRNEWKRNLTLVKHLTRRSIAARYGGSALGFAWSLLNPLLLMGVYTFVFQFVLPTTVPGVPYPVFFLTGVLAWNLFSVGSLMAGVSLLDGNTLVKKAAFPHITLPVSAVLASGVNYLATVPILIIFNVWFGIVPGLSLVLFPLLLVLLLVVAAAVGLLLAALIPRFRDLQHLVEILFMCWFLLTPVLYPMSQIESRLSAVQLIIYSLNPMVGVMNLVHAVFLGQPVSAIPMLVSGFGILVMFSLGLWVFHRLKDSLAEL